MSAALKRHRIPTEALISVDLETTGGGGKVIELGAVVLTPEGTLGPKVSTLVRQPMAVLTTKAARFVQHRVHGISPGEIQRHGVDEVEVAARFRSWIAAVRERWEGARLAAYGVACERTFLRKVPWGLEEDWYDIRGAVKAYHDAKGGKLSTVAPALGVDVGTSHRALDDARSAALVLATLRARLTAPPRRAEMADWQMARFREDGCCWWIQPDPAMEYTPQPVDPRAVVRPMQAFVARTGGER